MRAAVVARSEVVRLGLTHMLDAVSSVDDTAVFVPEELAATAPADAIQLLILSCQVLVLWCGRGGPEDAWAAEIATVAHHNGILVVLALPRGDSREPAMPYDGVLDQDSLTSTVLGDTLRRLADGERLAAPVWTGPPVGAPPVTPSTAGSALLTDRETRVLELLAEGLSNRRIGEALSISEHGAKRLVANLLIKLNSPNRTQAVAVALRDGLVRPRAAGHS